MRTFILLALAISAATALPNRSVGGAKDLSQWKSPMPHVQPHLRPGTWGKKDTQQSKPYTFKKGYKKVENCGIENTFDRIVGDSAEFAQPHQFPWLVALFCSGQWFCSGALINEEWILTAAHCVDGASYFEAYLGSTDLSQSNEEGRIVLTSTDGFTHPGWNSATLENDLALIKLPEAVDISGTSIRASCMPSSADGDFAGDLVTATGWGKQSDASGGKSDELRFIKDLPVMTNRECQNVYGSLITEKHLCIDSTKGGVCNGDSGGPLNLPTSGSSYKQVGIASFVSSAGCESGIPHGFTRVTSFLDWIESETGITFD